MKISLIYKPEGKPQSEQTDLDWPTALSEDEPFANEETADQIDHLNVGEEIDIGGRVV